MATRWHVVGRSGKIMSMRLTWFSPIAGMVLILLCPRAGFAEDGSTGPELLEQGISAYNDLRVEDSLRLLEQADRAGGLDGQLARLHLYRGLCRASTGENEAADASFRLSLALDSSLDLPPNQSPVVEERFEELRAFAQGSEGSGGGNNGPENPPPDDVGTNGPPDDVSEDPPPPPPPPAEPRPMIVTWVFLGLTGATFLGGTTTLILSQVTRSQARNDAHTQAEADDMLDTYRLETRLTIALLSSAVALGLSTLVAWLGERRRQSATSETTARSRRPAIALLPTLNGLVLTGHL